MFQKRLSFGSPDTAGHPGAIGGPRTSQTGAALIVGLIVLTALTLLSLSGMRNTRIQERMARNFRRSLAFQGAEAALRDAEAYLRQANLPPFDGSMPGLIDRLAGPGSAASWSKYDWARASRPVGITLPGLAAAPRYVIERLSAITTAGAGRASEPPPGPDFFRITARATGVAVPPWSSCRVHSVSRGAGSGEPGPGRRSWRQLR